MKRKTVFLTDFLCLLLCCSLIIGTFYGSDYISNTLSGIISHIMKLKTEEPDVENNMSVSPEVEEKAVFSPEGFGGGGYITSVSYETPSDILKLMKEAESIYKKTKKSGNIEEQQFGSASANNTYGDVDINNKTDEKISIKTLLETTPEYEKVTKSEPYILVYHTHTTEGYELLDKGWYSNSYNSRTKDATKNMVRVGEELVKTLEDSGYEVIHDKTIYDSSYNGAYNRSLVSVEKYMKKYPSIEITLDVHRDAIHYSDGTRCKPTALINGRKAAQVMIISGCEGDGVENFPQWKQNLTFAVHLQKSVEDNYNGLMRPIFFCNRKYNMNVTPCSLLLEFGTDANTLEEAVYSAQLIGESLGAMLDKESE